MRTIAGGDIVDPEHAALAFPVVLGGVEQAAVGGEETVAVEVPVRRRGEGRHLPPAGNIHHQCEPSRPAGENDGGGAVRRDGDVVGAGVELLGEEDFTGMIEDGERERFGAIHARGDEGGRPIGAGKRGEGQRAERRERLEETPPVSRHRAGEPRDQAERVGIAAFEEGDCRGERDEGVGQVGVALGGS